MREIKFRVYDTEKKELSYGFSIQDLASEMCYVVVAAQDRDELVWQQYTGLKDKNGVEIYEGDVLEYADGITPEQKFEVKFCDERGSFIFHELYIPTFEGSDLPGWDDVILGKNAWDGWEIADEAIVLGNIFEGVDK